MAFLRTVKGFEAGRLRELKEGSLVIGRNPSRCDLVLDHFAVSREHARIETARDVVHIEDLHSRNGVLVNGQLIKPGPEGRRQLDPSDRITIATFEFVYAEDLATAVCMTDQDEPEILSTVDIASDSSQFMLHERGAGRLRAVLRVIEELSSSLALEQVLPQMIDSLFRTFPQTQHGTVLLGDGTTNEFVPAVTRRHDGEETPIRLSRTLIQYVAQHKAAILSRDASSDSRFDASVSIREMRLRSLLCVPLVAHDAEVLGLIQLEAQGGPDSFTDDDLQLLAGVARHLAVVVENSRLHDAALKAQRDELEQRFRGLIEGSIQGILIHRLFKPLFVNEAWATLHGYTVEEVMRMPTVLPVISPDEHEQEIGYAQARLDGDRLPDRYVARGLRKDGSVIWLEKFVSLVDWEGGPAIQAAVIDVSDGKRAEDELRAARDDLERRVVKRTAELERSNRDLEQFAYSVSHDLQSPLRTVASYCQLLERRFGEKLDAEAHDFIAGAIDGTRRMKRLLDDLLDFSRVTTRAEHFYQTDANVVLREAVNNLQAAVEENEAEVTHDPLPSIVGDASQLMRLFQNLIDNAIRYRREERPRIHVGVHEDPDAWLFHVTDNGVGIESRHYDRIFKVFQRLYAEHEISGSGIGLAICRRIVERHEGRIWVESQPGQGSTFHIMLPKQPQQPTSETRRRT